MRYLPVDPIERLIHNSLQGEPTEKVCAEARAYRDRLREALAIVGRHLEDCCRSDIDWREQMASHDRAVRAVESAEAVAHGRDE